MSAATIDITPKSPIEEIAIFLPPAARSALGKAAELLEGQDVPVDAVVTALMGVGDATIGRGLDATIGGLEELASYLYTSGIMDRLGQINSFLRDGAEIGIQVSLNALKALTPGDVAKIVGVALIAWLAPQILLVSGPEFVDVAFEILGKLWNMA
jgi:hypothetical protein